MGQYQDWDTARLATHIPRLQQRASVIQPNVVFVDSITVDEELYSFSRAHERKMVPSLQGELLAHRLRIEAMEHVRRWPNPAAVVQGRKVALIVVLANADDVLSPRRALDAHRACAAPLLPAENPSADGKLVLECEIVDVRLEEAIHPIGPPVNVFAE